MKYKAIVFDIDGTLVDGKKKEVPISTINVIKQLQEKGIKVIIATGRPLYCAPIVEKANIKADFYVGSNGTIACNNKREIIYEKTIPFLTYQAIKQYCFENKISIFWKYRFEVYSEVRSKEGEKAFQELSNCKNQDLPNDKLANAASIVCDKTAYLKIKEKFNELVDIVDGGFLVYDLSPKGISKVDGLKACLDYLKISFEECVAFGDSENDLAMLKRCGLGICMGNGQEILKQQADYICDDVDKNGIEKALKFYQII